jgi:NADH dehydrogenase
VDKGNLATVGRAFAVAEFDEGKVRTTGFFAWILWLVVHIYYLIGFRNRLVVLLEWAWAYITFQRGARLITWETSKECVGGSISGEGSEGGTSGGSRSGSIPGGS